MLELGLGLMLELGLRQVGVGLGLVGVGFGAPTGAAGQSCSRVRRDWGWVRGSWVGGAYPMPRAKGWGNAPCCEARSRRGGEALLRRVGSERRRQHSAAALEQKRMGAEPKGFSHWCRCCSLFCFVFFCHLRQMQVAKHFHIGVASRTLPQVTKLPLYSQCKFDAHKICRSVTNVKNPCSRIFE